MSLDRPRGAMLVGLCALVALDTTMKAVSISRALQRGEKEWVVPLGIVNSIGILPAWYLRTHPAK